MFNFKIISLLILALISYNTKAQNDTLSASTANIDTLNIDIANGYLTYQVNYQQLLDTSVERGCSEKDFQHYLLYLTLYNLFTFLPLEATHHEGITVLATEVLNKGIPALRIEAPLQELLHNTNEPFRMFMQSQALRGLGNCFTADESQLKAWLLTVGTLQNSDMYYDTNLFDFESLYQAYTEQRQQVENFALEALQSAPISRADDSLITSSEQISQVDSVANSLEANPNEQVPQDTFLQTLQPATTNNEGNSLGISSGELQQNTVFHTSPTLSDNETYQIPSLFLQVPQLTPTNNFPRTTNDSLAGQSTAQETSSDSAVSQDVVIGSSSTPNDTSNINQDNLINSAVKQGDLFIPKDYSLTPFLSNKRVVNFSKPKKVFDTSKDYAAVLETTQGRILIDLLEENAPTTVNNFIFLALNHYYDNVPFHRVIEEFIAQTGDHTGTSWGGPGYWLEPEIDPSLSHLIEGMVSMASDGEKSSGSQFFFTLSPSPDLDGQYTIFGKVLDGLDVLQNLQLLNIQEEPSIFANLQDSLALLAIQGIELAGDEDISLEDYILELYGELPELEERFKIDFVDAVILNDPVIDELFIAFWPMPDLIEQLYIVER